MPQIYFCTCNNLLCTTIPLLKYFFTFMRDEKYMVRFDRDIFTYCIFHMPAVRLFANPSAAMSSLGFLNTCYINGRSRYLIWPVILNKHLSFNLGDLVLPLCSFSHFFFLRSGLIYLTIIL